MAALTCAFGLLISRAVRIGWNQRLDFGMIFRHSTVLRAHLKFRPCGWLEFKGHACMNAAVQPKRLSALELRTWKSHTWITHRFCPASLLVKRTLWEPFGDLWFSGRKRALPPRRMQALEQGIGSNQSLRLKHFIKSQAKANLNVTNLQKLSSWFSRVWPCMVGAFVAVFLIDASGSRDMFLP